MANQGSDRVQRQKRLRMALSNKATKNSGERIERIFDSPQVITIGTSEACTFRVQRSPTASGSFALIVPENGEFRLQIADGMKGWIILKDGESKQELSPAPTWDKRFDTCDDGCAVTLLDDSKGKVSIGSDSILFQVIEEEVSEESVRGSTFLSALKPTNNLKNSSQFLASSTSKNNTSLLFEDQDRAKKAHEAWMTAKSASENAQQRAWQAQNAKEKALHDVSSLEAELKALEARLLEAREAVREAETTYDLAQGSLREAQDFESLAQQEASKAQEAIELALRERERIRAEEAVSSMALETPESANADNDEYDDEDDDGPLVLPTYENVAIPKDHLFSAVMLIVFVLNFGFMTAVSLVPMPEPKELTLEDIPERFAQVIIPEKPKDEPVIEDTPQQATDVEAKTESHAKVEKAPSAAAIDSQKFSSKEERRAAIREGVQGKGLLKLLGALGGDGGDGDAIQDVLGGGSDSSNDIASALMGASGVGVATSESIAKQAGQRMGGGSGEVATIGELGTSGGASAQATKITEKKAVVITGRVIDEGPELESSDCDRNAIARYVRGRMKAIQNCYERELKKNPSLKGKIVVRFTINEQGKVTDFSIEEETIGNTAVIACIRNTIRVWRFPIKDNECPVAYPFIFAPSS